MCGGSPDHRDQRNLRQGGDDRFDLGGVDPLAPRFDQILGAAGDGDVAARIDARKIPGIEPAIVGRVLAVTEIALDDRRAAHLEAALEPALFGQRAPIAIGEEQRSEEHTSELQSLMRISYAVFCLKKKKLVHSTR